MAGERRHADYRAWLLMQPCCCQPCVSSVVIHHHTAGETEPHAKSLGGRRGKSQRCSDTQGMPLCFRHHKDLHELRGFFAEEDKHSLRKWQDDQVKRLQRLYEMAYPEPLVTAAIAEAKRKRIGAGWTVATIHSWLRAEARVRPAAAADALTELANLIEEDCHEH